MPQQQKQQMFNVDQQPLILDGGLGTELERRGFNISDPLWSAKLLRDNPQAIREVHSAYFKAGAQCITTNSYQATIPGFVRAGVSQSEAVELLWRSVELANEAREIAKLECCAAAADELNGGRRRLPDCGGLTDARKFKVLRSCGPYAAYLHDGSEYTGIYKGAEGKDIEDREIAELHRSRLNILRRDLPDGDRIVFETIPSKREGKVVHELLKEFPDLRGKVWISFSCQSPANLCSGDSFKDVVIELLKADQQNNFISGIGLNCTKPKIAVDCMKSLRQVDHQLLASVNHVPITLICYPNSGEDWDTGDRCFSSSPAVAQDSLISLTPALLDCGVRAIGGCCRVYPETITEIRAEVERWKMKQQKSLQ